MNLSNRGPATHSPLKPIVKSVSISSAAQINPFSLRTLLLLLLLSVTFPPAYAEETEEEGEAEPVGSVYFAIDPPFVTNYGGTNRLRYVKVEVTLKVEGDGGVAQVTHHMPQIRDAFLTLFSQQSSEDINSIEGKEALRAKSLEEISSILQDEDDKNHLQEVLFTNFVAHSL